MCDIWPFHFFREMVGLFVNKKEFDEKNLAFTEYMHMKKKINESIVKITL
jgi:predicted metal-binding transcription factor (methanogenesis marker protein 9)